MLLQLLQPLLLLPPLLLRICVLSLHQSFLLCGCC
jgi:hypothetical protein